MAIIREFTIGNKTFFVDENYVTHEKVTANDEAHKKWMIEAETARLKSLGIEDASVNIDVNGRIRIDMTKYCN